MFSVLTRLGRLRNLFRLVHLAHAFWMLYHHPRIILIILPVAVLFSFVEHWVKKSGRLWFPVRDASLRQLMKTREERKSEYDRGDSAFPSFWRTLGWTVLLTTIVYLFLVMVNGGL